MKKLFTCLLLFIATLPAFSQILVEEHFDNYMGLNPVPPAGWFISWNNGDTNVAALSYYYSVSPTYQYCGMTCPTYKFGIDSAYMISPAFANADSVKFYMKGNGTPNANRFQVYGGPDTNSWSLIRSFDTISATPVIQTLPVPGGTTRLKFIYIKDASGYNVGFDDVYIFQGTFNGISAISKPQMSVYPNPTKGNIYFDFKGEHPKNTTIIFNNVLGMEVKRITLLGYETKYQYDLSDLKDGIYFVKIKSDAGQITQRIVLRK